jgi:hypothetical protein
MARSVCRGRNRSGAARPGVLHLACHLLGGGFEDRNHRERGGAHAAAPAGACARGARADADASLRKGRKQRLALAAAAVTPNYASCCGGGESDNGGRNQRDLCGVAGGEAAALRRLVVARPRRRQARRVCDVAAPSKCREASKTCPGRVRETAWRRLASAEKRPGHVLASGASEARGRMKWRSASCGRHAHARVSMRTREREDSGRERGKCR